MEADISSQAVGLASSADFSLLSLFIRADIIVKTVIILLIVCSVYSWAVIIEKIRLFKKINQFTKLSFPLLVGVSRKSMVKKMVGDIENDIIQASVLLACLAVQNGAKILRVHDVKETFNAISVLQAV